MVDLELESQVLAAMLNEEECLVTGLTELKEGDFSDTLYRAIFQQANQLFSNNHVVNATTIYEQLKDQCRGHGTSWMMVKDGYIHPSTFVFYVDKIKKLTKLRKLSGLAKAIMNNIQSNADADELLLKVENEIYSLSVDNKSEQVITPQQQAERILDTVTKRMSEDERSKKSVFTSFKRLNMVSGGYEAGDLIIISGPTGAGKSAFALNQMHDISVTQKFPGLYINTEMSQDQIDIRCAAVLSSDWQVTNSALRTGQITQDQLEQLTKELDAIYKSELYFITIPDLNIPKMISTVRRYSRQKGIRVIVIDYIGRMDLMDQKKEDWQVLVNAARKLKTLAQQYKLIIFMLSQVDSQGKLAMAKYMEHEADLHLHIRPINDNEKHECLEKMEYYWDYVVSIEKGRSAPKGYIPVRFAGEKLRFITEPDEAAAHVKLTNDERPMFTQQTKKRKG